MTEKFIIEEKALLYRLQCPIRSIGPSIGPEVPVLVCAESTASWLIREMFNGRQPTVTETFEKFDVHWLKTAYFRSKDGIPPKEYALRVREGITACRRLRDIVWRCEILQPISPYRLAIGSIVITGAYAVLRSPRRKKHAFALYLRHQGTKIKPLVPDVVSFARRLDLANRWIDPANRHWGIQSIGVMHYWVSRDLSAEHKPDREFATDVLLGAAGVVTGNPFPVPGDYCLSCPTRACRPDDLIGPPDTLHRMEPADVKSSRLTVRE